MAIVSQTKFAELSGRTRQAIYQRVHRGTLIATVNKQLDTEDPINAQFLKEVENEKRIAEFNKKQISEKIEVKKTVVPIPEDPDTLSTDAANAKRNHDILKCRKLELEVKELEGELIRRDFVHEACFGYLTALNINIMEMPQSFLDELENAIINKANRSDKMQIIVKPICEAIESTQLQIEKKLKEKND